MIVEFFNPDGTTSCVTDPTDCCAPLPPILGCCDNQFPPAPWCLTIFDAAPGSECLNGNYLMTDFGPTWAGALCGLSGSSTLSFSCDQIGRLAVIWTYFPPIGPSSEILAGGFAVSAVCSTDPTKFRLSGSLYQPMISGTDPYAGAFVANFILAGDLSACGG